MGWSHCGTTTLIYSPSRLVVLMSHTHFPSSPSLSRTQFSLPLFSRCPHLPSSLFLPFTFPSLD
ncbi:hypothetical protein SLEP1_g57165 [Rubroshorea leprosula]|uniref:Uncharacterized protein n=1 Tax=Rubroshorea leprosula TaxID=152421 RepID=A0AAV5MLQ5_9ROSI|nr:hypothetical protein SLEP1_g57165 [Rubroshorea leprosula]